MLEKEDVEKPLKEHLMHLSFEDGTPDYQIVLRAKLISEDLFEDVKLGSYTKVGTIVLFDISFTDAKVLKPRNELNGDEYLLRLLTLKHFEGLD